MNMVVFWFWLAYFLCLLIKPEMFFKVWTRKYCRSVSHWIIFFLIECFMEIRARVTFKYLHCLVFCFLNALYDGIEGVLSILWADGKEIIYWYISGFLWLMGMPPAFKELHELCWWRWLKGGPYFQFKVFKLVASWLRSSMSAKNLHLGNWTLCWYDGV